MFCLFISSGTNHTITKDECVELLAEDDEKSSEEMDLSSKQRGIKEKNLLYAEAKLKTKLTPQQLEEIMTILRKMRRGNTQMEIAQGTVKRTMSTFICFREAFSLIAFSFSWSYLYTGCLKKLKRLKIILQNNFSSIS